ncbi:hypothetical protein [Marinobacter zhejiangensis]|uniref:MAPEG family protein n=1 Tax=Marinobacter zhejiangensis TaxID=488535 RepID=A0A1I4PY97_9GAMM|nr:hypothetical protein [Marinobacter zhejiangensis]SFM32801.1 hypothetical protein SAMN04487963_2072 [Marinobacter zhejiangensis]
MSFPEVGPAWLLLTAAIAMLISLLEAWLATLIIYGKVRWLKKIFPATHNLIRSHVDYTIMTALTGFVYYAIDHLALSIPDAIIVIYCVGVLYNPAGFIAKAINPNMGNSDTVLGRAMVCIGFLPATIGFGYIMVAIILKLI